VKLPYLFTDILKDFLFLGTGGDKSGQKTFSVNPAKRMVENVELSCVITDDKQTSGETTGKDAAQQSSFCGNFDMTWFGDSQ
jgi:hypothetical protein